MICQKSAKNLKHIYSALYVICYMFYFTAFHPQKILRFRNYYRHSTDGEMETHGDLTTSPRPKNC